MLPGRLPEIPKPPYLFFADCQALKGLSGLVAKPVFPATTEAEAGEQGAAVRGTPRL